MRCATLSIVTCLALVASAAAADSVDPGLLEQALRDELERSMAELKLEELERPYYIAYQVQDVHTASAEASLGSLVASNSGHRRSLIVEVRVGSYEFDNTNFVAGPQFGGSQLSFRGPAPLPLGDDYREIRRQVWLATDAAYKSALEDLARKKSALENKTRTEELPDFTPAEPHDFRDPTPLEAPDPEADLVAELSARLKAPEVFTSRVRYRASAVRTLYLDSEGTSYTRVVADVELSAVAATQAEDGMWLDDSMAFYGRRLEDLPEASAMGERLEAMAERLSDLRSAQLIDLYNGPVLFEPAAAAELFAQAFVPKLLARRRPVAGDERLAMMLERNDDEDFKDRLGARVLPRFLSAVDDPTASELDGQPLFGGFPVDDEGTLTAATSLIERGYLKTLLTDRTPVKGAEGSTGNRRAGGVAPSNLIFRVERGGFSDEELREELMTLVADRGAEFAILVRRLTNPEFTALHRSSRGRGRASGTSVVAAFQVYPDGREVLLRNVEISGLDARSFRDIVAASAASHVIHRPFRPVNPDPFAGRYYREIPLISLATPAVLFEELTLKKPSREVPQLPAVPKPGLESLDP